MTPESELADMYRALHAQGVFLGLTWRLHLKTARKFFSCTALPVLDYGCGPRGGLAEALGDLVIPYDPFIPEFSADPWSRKPGGVFSSDVLEHMPVRQVDDLLEKICDTPSVRRVLAVVSVRPANKTIPNGVNMHLTVCPPEWWEGLFDDGLGRRFNREWVRFDSHRKDVTLAYSAGS